MRRQMARMLAMLGLSLVALCGLLSGAPAEAATVHSGAPATTVTAGGVEATTAPTTTPASAPAVPDRADGPHLAMAGGEAGQPAMVPGSLWDKLKDASCVAGVMRSFDPLCADKVAKSKVGKIVKNQIDFWTDPIGAIAGKMQEAAYGLVNEVLPQLIRATSPDFTLGWFVEAYQVSFGIGIGLFGALLLWTMLDYSRPGGHTGSEDVVDTLFVEAPKFMLGSAFGPVVAGSIVKLFEALTVGIVKWGLGSSVKSIGEATKALEALIRAGTPNSLPGGSMIAIGLYLILLLGLAVLVLVMVVAFVTLYMSGAIAPVAWSWLGNPRTRDRAWKIVRVFGGLVVAKPVSFVMLAMALKLTTNGLFGVAATSKAVDTLIGLAAAGIALIFVGLAPMALAKFGVGVGPTEASGGGGASRVSPGRGARGGAGKSTPSNGQLAQASSTGGGGSAAAPAAAGAAAGGGAGMAMAMAGDKFKSQLQDSGQGGSEASSGGGDSDGSGLADQSNSGDSATGQDGDGTQGHSGGTQGHSGQGQSGGMDSADAAGGQGRQAALAGTGGGGDGEQQDGRGGQDGDSSGGGFGRKLAGAAASTGSGAGRAARVGAAGLRQAAAKGSTVAGSLDEQLEGHLDHGASGGRRPR